MFACQQHTAMLIDDRCVSQSVFMLDLVSHARNFWNDSARECRKRTLHSPGSLMCATLRRAISFAATQPNFLNRTAQIAFQRNVLATERTFNPRSYLSHIRQSMTDGEATAAVTATTVEDLEKMTIPDLKSWLKATETAESRLLSLWRETYGL